MFINNRLFEILCGIIFLKFKIILSNNIIY